MLRSLFKLLDFLVDHWDQIAWLVPGVALLAAWGMGWWAVITALHPVEIITIALTVTAAMLAILTLLPQYLRQKFPRPFAVSVSSILTKGGTPYNNVHLSIYIINRSPKNRVILEFAMCFRSKGGKENWSRQPTSENIISSLGPHEPTSGHISFNMGPVDDLIPSEPNGVFLTTSERLENRTIPEKSTPESGMYLQVIDRISGRWVLFRIPGAYPPNFFIP